MKAEVQNDLREEFDGDLSEGVQVITFKQFTNAYNTATGRNVRTPSDLTTRGLVKSYTEAEMLRSGGSISETDLKVTIISDEITKAPKIGDMCDVLGILYKVKHFATDALGASYILRLVEDNG